MHHTTEPKKERPRVAFRVSYSLRIHYSIRLYYLSNLLLIRTGFATQDISNHFNEDCAKHAKAVKRAKSQLKQHGTIASSSAYSATLATEESVETFAISSISYSNGNKPRNLKNEVPPHASSKSVQISVPESVSTACAVNNFDHDGPNDIIDQLVSTKPLLSTSNVQSIQSAQKDLCASSKSWPGVLPQRLIAPTARTTSRLVNNIDDRDKDDPLLVTAYVRQIYEYYRAEEHQAIVGPYMQGDQDFNATARAILIDWLCEVHHKWKLHPETLFLTVNVLDRYLAKANVTKKTLQLVGSCALLIASKYEEIYSTPVGDLVYVCDGAFEFNDVSEFWFCSHIFFYKRTHCTPFRTRS